MSKQIAKTSFANSTVELLELNGKFHVRIDNVVQNQYYPLVEHRSVEAAKKFYEEFCDLLARHNQVMNF